jgi:plastocyanin
MQVAGAGGLAIVAASLLKPGAQAALQDASPEAMPMMPDVEIGPRDDGTTVWKVQVGGMDMENLVEFHTFFPNEITINAGDAIWFAYDMPMFHTVTFPGADGPPPIFISDPEAPASATPEAGPPKLVLNPVMLTGAGGDVVDGSQLVSTSVDAFSDPTVPWIFTFPTAGTYDFVCIPHAPVMQGRVVVQEAGSELPMDQAAIDAASAERLAELQAQGLAEIEQYMTPVSEEKEDGGTRWTVAAGAGGFSPVRVMRFLPDNIEITAGDSINYVNASEGEPHTATFVGPDTEQPTDILEETFADGSPKLVQSMETFLPQGGNVWSGTGFLNSGFMGIPELGLPMEFEVLFDTPGEFIVYCILHGTPDGERMAGRVTVNAAG